MSPFAGLVAGGVGWLESRDDNKWMTQGGFNNNNRSRTGVFQTATNQTTQQMFFNELKFSAARSIRTSTIILASFNIIAAFATAVGILCDSYFRRRRNDKTFKFWYDDPVLRERREGKKQRTAVFLTGILGATASHSSPRPRSSPSSSPSPSLSRASFLPVLSQPASTHCSAWVAHGWHRSCYLVGFFFTRA